MTVNTTIRNLEDWVLNEINQQAAASGRSQQGYLKHILGEIAKTPLPLNRDVLFDLLKEFHREFGMEPAVMTLPANGEVHRFLASITRDERGGEPPRFAGMDVIFESLPVGVHAAISSRERARTLCVDTELIWRLAGKVDRNIQLR